MGSDLHDYWDSFYAGKRSQDVPDEPSAFAIWAKDRISAKATIWEFGFGTARDALWFAQQGYNVRGFDFAESAVDHARLVSARRDAEARFDVLDLGDQGQVGRLVDEANSDRSVSVNIYGRFLIHSLTDAARQHLFDVASAVANGGFLLLEFRTGQDAAETHLFGDDHFRKYLDSSDVVAEIQARGGNIIERIESKGMAVYKTEDPHVARLIAVFG